MEKKIRQIIDIELAEDIKSIKEIIGLGQVNSVYEIIGARKNYIIRANEEGNKEIEYLKEEWCLKEAKKLGVKSPEVLKLGKRFGINYMIQEKIEGTNGQQCNPKEQLKIWKKLGIYAKKYHKINRIEVEEFEKNEFHANWKARLAYNIKELNETDSLLKNKVLTHTAHQKSKWKLRELQKKTFKVGLIHGDLCPRNVILSNKEVYLLDWGTAEINVIPHHEIGLVMLEKEANEAEFDNFMEGLGLSNLAFSKMKADILKFNFLHRLDKYRWAESYDLENIAAYEIKIRETFERIK